MAILLGPRLCPGSGNVYSICQGKNALSIDLEMDGGIKTVKVRCGWMRVNECYVRGKG